ncbi:hypothetical protein [Streptomyces sp. NPDC048350]
MPAYDTPRPSTAFLDFEDGTVRIAVGERASTVVEIRARTGVGGLVIRRA